MLALPVFLLLVLLRLTGIIEPIGLRIYDAYNRVYASAGSSERVVVIGFGDSDFAIYPDYPFSDALLAQVLDRVHAAAPSAVLLNLLRDVPVGSGHEELLQRYTVMPNLYGISAIKPLAREDVPAPPVLREAGRFGMLQSMADEVDGTTRVALLGHRDQDRLLESVLIKVLREDLARHDMDARIAADGRLWLGTRSLPAIDEQFGEYQRAELGGLLAYLLPYRHQRIEVIGFSELLAEGFDSQRLSQRVVLIGNSALSLQRPWTTPVTTRAGRGLSGVELNAALIDNLLAYAHGQGIGLRALPEYAEYLLLFLLSWLAVWRFMVYRSLMWGLLRGSVLVLAISALGYLAFRLGLWLPLGAMAITLVVSALVVIDNLLRAAAGQRRLVAFMDQVFDRLPEPMYVLDHRGSFRHVNEGYSRLAGLPPDELIGSDAAQTQLDEGAGQATLRGAGRAFALTIQRSDMADEHGRPLTLGLVRAAIARQEDCSQAQRAAMARTALWWAARGRGALLVASIRLLDPELLKEAFGSDALAAADAAMRQRLRSAFADALDLWSPTPGCLLLMLARSDAGFDADSLKVLLRQSFSWPLQIDQDAIDVDLAIGAAIGRNQADTLDGLVESAHRDAGPAAH